MKTKNSIVLFALVFSSAAFAQKKQAPVKYKLDKVSGIEYHIVNPNKGERIKEDMVAVVDLSYKTSKDSVMFDSWKTGGGPLQILVTKPTFKGDIMDGLKLLTANDSALILLNADSTFLKTFGAELPHFIDKGSKLTFTIKVHRVATQAQLQQEEIQTKVQKSLQEGTAIEKYIADNRLNVVKTESGLRYSIINEGTGEQATAGKTLKVNYTGKLLDGRIFDSSIGKEPIEFQLGVGMVIKGWDEGFLFLKQGGKAFFIIPSELAYGARGAGGLIPPYAPLTFEVELLEVK